MQIEKQFPFLTLALTPTRNRNRNPDLRVLRSNLKAGVGLRLRLRLRGMGVMVQIAILTGFTEVRPWNSDVIGVPLRFPGGIVPGLFLNAALAPLFQGGYGFGLSVLTCAF